MSDLLLKESRLKDVINIGLCQAQPLNIKPRIGPAHQAWAVLPNHGSSTAEVGPS